MTMLSATRRWFSRNRTPLAVGVGIVGAGYVAAQYLVSKIRDDRERLGSDRIAKENLRRRFEQNQEDCTFTVLALLPTATENILDAMNTERITLEIQQLRGSGGSGVRSSLRPAVSASAPPSIADTAISMTDDDGRSLVSMPTGEVDNGGKRALSTVDEGSAAGSVDKRPSTPPHAFLAPSPVPPGPKRKTKRQLWDDLTISSITRAFTLIYTLALLTLLTRVQLNLLGRRSYLTSVVSLATGPAQAPISLENHDDDNAEQAYASDFGTNRKYLTFSWWLLNRGWLVVRDRVEGAVRRAYGHLSPRDSLSLSEFKALAERVRDEVEGRTPLQNTTDNNDEYVADYHNDHSYGSASWLECLLPPRDLEDLVLRESGVLDDAPDSEAEPLHPIPRRRRSNSDTTAPAPPSLRHLLDETADLIESAHFAQVLARLLDAGFALLLDSRLAEGAFDTLSTAPDEASSTALAPPKTTRTLLPKMLSVMTRQAHVIGSGMPNEYLSEMERVRDLEAFAAVVYSSNWENEIRAYSQGHDEMTAAQHQERAEHKGSAWAPVTGAEEALRREEDAKMGVSAWSVVVPASSPLAESGVVVDPAGGLEDAWSRAFKG